MFNIQEDSLLKGHTQLGVKVMAVDDNVVMGMPAISVSKLLGRRSRNP